LRGLSEGQKVIYELQTDRRTGKTSAVNLKVAAMAA
jgi:CspA family cold shock protein